MFKLIRPAIVLMILLTVLTGIVYPALTTLLSYAAFPAESQGSLIVHNGQVYGSALIGQPFNGENYFQSRPSATAPMPYNAESSSGSNLSQGNPSLADAVKVRVDEIKTKNPTWDKAIPADLVTTSASGLDPHISPQAAELQIDRIAKDRNLDPKNLQKLVDQYTESRAFGILGEPTVNVLMLNLALDHPDWQHPVNQPVLYRWHGFLPE